MSEIIQNWREEKINNLVQELAKLLLANAKEEQWHIYGLSIKKDKKGKIFTSDPTFEEIELLKQKLQKD